MTDDMAIVFVVFGLGLAPLAATMVRGRQTGTKAMAAGVMLLSFAAFMLAASLVNANSSRPPPFVGVPRQIDEEEYVGSGACLSCHPYEHATWHASYHRTMTQMASPESIAAPFDGTVLHLEEVDWTVQRRGDEFWVRGRDATNDVQARVAMATGSHNYQVYWLESDGKDGLYQFPLVYLLYEQTWIPRKSRFLQPPIERTPIETGRWQSHCIKCHATRGRKEHPRLKAPTIVETGISCEACHGPGGGHVAANQNPLRRYAQHLGEEPDPTIVNPARLPHDRASQVCAQCHSIEIFLDQQKAADWAKDGSRFRPGDELAKFQTSMVGRYEDNPPEVQKYLDEHATFRLEYCFWSDGTLRVTGREYHGMLESPCYQRGEMSCLSCHRLHRSQGDPRPFRTWADDQLDEGMRGDEACLQCHEKYASDQAIVDHTHHPIDSQGSRCQNCHMSYTTWGLLRAIRSHTVDSPSVATSLSTGRPNACNQCHLDQTLAWTGRTLREWYGTEPPALSDDERDTAASILWTLSGDAGQRALMAWSMGWQPAREASGTDWMVPFLTAMLMDPYHAVRFNAQRSLRNYPAYAEIAADGKTGATKEQHRQMAKQALEHWQQSFPTSSDVREPRLLLLPDGRVDPNRFRSLAEQRNNRRLVLFE